MVAPGTREGFQDEGTTEIKCVLGQEGQLSQSCPRAGDTVDTRTTQVVEGFLEKFGPLILRSPWKPHTVLIPAKGHQEHTCDQAAREMVTVLMRGCREAFGLGI